MLITYGEMCIPEQKKPRITDTKILCGTKWLSFKEATYDSKEGKDKKWGYVDRTGDAKVVMIIPVSEKTGKMLFVSQFRIPVRKFVITFPAGLTDKGETVKHAARRELKEETGYGCKRIKSVSRELPKSAGLTSESMFVVECVVDEKAVGKTSFDEDEDIQSFWKTPRQLVNLMKELDKKYPGEYTVEASAWTFIDGYCRRK